MSNLDIAINLVPRGTTVAEGALFIYAFNTLGNRDDARLDDAGGNITLRWGNAAQNAKPVQIAFHLPPDKLRIGREDYELEFPAGKAMLIDPGKPGTQPVFDAPVTSDGGKTLVLVSRRRDAVTYKYTLNVIARSPKGVDEILVDDPKIKNGGVSGSAVMRTSHWMDCLPPSLVPLGVGVLVTLTAQAVHVLLQRRR